MNHTHTHTHTQGCEIIDCTNARAGEYYTQVTEERSAYLESLHCPVAPCSPPGPDRRFVKGSATNPDACPTTQCNVSTLPKGHYFELSNNYTECTAVACETKTGAFYLHGAEGGRSGCANVRSDCINAELGEEYAEQTTIVVSKSRCPVKPCSPPPAGKHFGTKGSCNKTDYVPCNTASPGSRYVQSPVSSPCQVIKCTNADVGQYYTTGNARDDPDWQTKVRGEGEGC